MKAKVLTGVDLLFKKSPIDLKNKRVALLAHAASVNRQLEHTRDVLLKNKINLTKLFGPEHGIDGTAQDMIGVENHTDLKSGLPTVSLYGSHLDSLKPKKSDFENVDILIVDLQDIGSRYYTYIYTMAFCMEVCGPLKIPVLVLDRPNPINGIDIEGNILKTEYQSFVGAYPLLIRHGMTIGELACYFNEEFSLNCNLHILKMKGWQREFYFDQTDLPWVSPSPNMPTLNTALVYPGMCLFEATEISEARGTTKPFEYVGAPFIDASNLTHSLEKLNLPGVKFRPIAFEPKFQKCANEICHGVQLHLTNRNQFKPYLTGLFILKTLFDLYPSKFKWREKPYEFVTTIPAIDLLTGDKIIRELIENRMTFHQYMKDILDEEKHFEKVSRKYLLY